MRILILDDQPKLASILALYLRGVGYQAIGYMDAKLALGEIEKDDVLITDYHLSETTGLEVARQAYAQGWRGPLLLMSGHRAAIRESVEHPLLHLFLDKPFSCLELVNALPASAEGAKHPKI